MALSDTLAGIPGYAGYQAARLRNQQEEQAQLQQFNGLQGILSQVQKQQMEEQTRAALSQSGGDPEVAMASLIKSGNIAGAHSLAPVAKMAAEKRQAEETAKGLAAINAPDEPQELGAGQLTRTGGGEASSPLQQRIGRLKQMQLLYAKNPAVTEKIQAQITKLETDAKPMVEHNFSVGENQVQPHISYDQGRTWQPIPGSKPSAKFAKMIPDDAPSVTDDTLEMDAYRYLTDGTLPPNMGRGAQGAGQATKIRNRSSEIAKEVGMSPDEIRFQQLQNKAQVSAILQLGKARAQILQFEKTANMNSDLALEASEKVDRTGVPVLNRWLQAGRTEIAGDPEASKFHAATETFVSEYAKVMGGGYGASATTEGAQNRAHTLLNTANTKEQFRDVVGQLKKEMANRVSALNGQMDEEKQRLRGGIRPPKPETPQPANPVPANTQGWGIRPL